MKTGSHPGIRRNTPGTAFVALELYTRHTGGIRDIVYMSCLNTCLNRLFSCLNTWCLNTCFGVSTLAT